MCEWWINVSKLNLGNENWITFFIASLCVHYNSNTFQNEIGLVKHCFNHREIPVIAKDMKVPRSLPDTSAVAINRGQFAIIPIESHVCTRGQSNPVTVASHPTLKSAPALWLSPVT